MTNKIVLLNSGSVKVCKCSNCNAVIIGEKLRCPKCRKKFDKEIEKETKHE